MPTDPLQDLALALWQTHRYAGEPSARKISKETEYSHTTVAKAMRCDRCPSWPVLRAIVNALQGDEDYFRVLWIAVRDAEAPLAEAVDHRFTSELEQPTRAFRSPARVSGLQVPLPRAGRAVSNAKFIEQRGVPDAMRQGQMAMVSITMKNTGTTIWSPKDHFRLGAQAPHDNEFWLPNGGNRVELPIPLIAPGDLVTFSFVIRPKLPGQHAFQWRMVWPELIKIR